MKFRPQILAAALVTAAALALSSCSAPNGYSYSNVTLNITVACSDCGSLPISYNPAYPQPPASGSVLYMPGGGGQGGVYQLTANVTNAPASSVTWQIFPTQNLTLPNPPPTGTSQPGPGGSSVGQFNNPGNLNNQTATGATVFYQAAGSPPIYTDAALQQAETLGIPQGDVLIVASVPTDPSNPSATVSVGQLIQSYGTGAPGSYMVPQEPGTPANLTVSVAQIARNTTFQFYGGFVGAAPCTVTPVCNINGTTYPTYTADNSAIWSVGATQASATALCNAPPPAAQPPAGCPYGWISSTGLYTAPPVVPTTPKGSGLANGQVVVVMTSHSSPATSKFANISVY